MWVYTRPSVVKGACVVGWAQVVLVLLSTWLSGCSRSGSELNLPKPFPSLTLSSLDRRPIDFTDFRGRVVVLNVWATWCKPCRDELPSLQTLAQSLDPERFKVVLLSVDDDDHVAREYLRDKNIQLETVWDPGGAVVLPLLEIDRFPYSILVSSAGEIVGRIAGERVWHTQAMVQQLERLYAHVPGEAIDLVE